jgi:Protein of unknown function (DUF4038)/Putative collagen-binding domain of a collagenase
MKYIESLERRQLFSNLPPLSVGANRFNLVDNQNQPIFISGDAGWSIFTGINQNDADLYLAKRVSKGMNFILANAIEARFNGPVNEFGQFPFADMNRPFINPNERYWQNVDYVMTRADEMGVYVFLFPAYLGFAGSQDGWYRQLIDAGTDTAYRYGRFIGNRYKNFGNLIWTLGGDRDIGEAYSVTNALISGIRSTDAKQLVTAHAGPNIPGARTYNDARLDFNTTYSYEPSYQRTRMDRAERGDLPTFLFEDNYENRSPTTAQTQRAQKYWSVLSGGSGALMGNFPLWQFLGKWRDQLDSKLAFDMQRLKQVFQARNWTQLRADFDNQYVTQGRGSYGQLDYVAAAATTDRRLMMAYLPSSRSVQINLGRFSAPVFGKWFDPSSGRMIQIWDGVRSNSGFTTVAPPSTNDSGFSDWVLIVEADYRGNKTDASASPVSASKPQLTMFGDNAVRIAWQDRSSNELGVRVQRRQAGQSKYRTIAEVGVQTIAWIDRTTGQGVTYDYRIISSNTAGESKSSVTRITVRPGASAASFSAVPIFAAPVERKRDEILD